MKEWLKNMAAALKLPEGTPETEILAKAGEFVTKGVAAQSQLSAVAAQLAAHNFKLDGDKLSKVEVPPVADSPEVADLKKRVALQEAETAKVRLSAARNEVETIMAKGALPPTVKDALSRILMSTGKAESVALSADSSSVVKTTVDILADLRTVLNAVPSTTGARLSQFSVVKPEGDDKGGKKEGQSLGSTVASRIQGKKKA